MKPSVIIPAYNAEHTLAGCLSALASQSIPPFEIIVVDDASHDNTFHIAEAAGVQVVRLEKNRGPAAARNAGVARSTGDILCFTDADCEPDNHWLAALISPFAKDKTIAGTKGVYRLKTSHLIARFVQLEYESRYQRMRQFEQIDFVDTYSAAYRRDIFEAAGGFDESLPVDEDQDLSFRLAAVGAKLIFVPDASVAHHHVTTLWAYARRKYRIAFWKMYLLRHMPAKAVQDSHTPPTLKLQIVLSALMGLSLAASIFSSFFMLLFGLFITLFFISAIMFIMLVLRKDAPVLLIFPLMLFIRAYALGIGMLVGFGVFWLRLPVT
ncbi:MAG: glycosyltransferase [Anaerolineae bacterium]|nr:glycosyltransferase [Anaerolineae bacterium]